jgi:hypothetical protein
VKLPHLPGFTVRADGAIIGRRGRELRAFSDKDGYLRVNHYHAGKWSQHFVHVLVCEAFHGGRPQGAHVGHRDGSRVNNCAGNLRWVTPRQNEADKVAHGTALRGERHHRAILTEPEVREIRAQRAAGALLSTLSRRFGVAEATISRIALRQSWRHI